ncbi:amino acid adenylation domain-containing protein [Leptolyngbya sp. FACHB-261]|uniref:non-ribosomal peptide synthetase n=1 Tax=Leptolyngbya sp. FACHB-261 TaxID=2692806 RepID=UPI001687E3A8|nr:non-ribosomal peptide synthetase [Leptolyngbya sp. FACHB-261]MBD2103127.1 amino acid adenylation domain-containing protein [Leptolyngbya sp. FACHB-261]
MIGDSLAVSESEAEVFVFPASFAQQRLWFLDQLVPNHPFYNVPAAIRLVGTLNQRALKQTFNEIVRRHEVLRTTFVPVKGQLMQVIAPSLSLPLPVIDLRRLPRAEREVEAQHLATQEGQRPFQLAQGPLLRVTLLQLDEADQVLLLNMHHIVADGWSSGILIRELTALYTAFVRGQSSPLPELPLQYADFADWQHQWLQGEILEQQLVYWRQQLQGVSRLNLPTDRPRPSAPSYQGEQQWLILPKSLSQALEALSQRMGVTLFMTLLAAFQVLLCRYSGQEDIAVGSPIANRNRSEIEGLIGFFANSLVLRLHLAGNPSFEELLGRVREVTLGAYTHQDLPFEKLVEALQPERDLSSNPLFQVVFALQNAPLEGLDLLDLKLSPFSFENKTARFDLELHLWDYPEGLRGKIVYSTDLFEASTISRLLGHFQVLLEGIVRDPKQRLLSLPILTLAEQQILLGWNQTQANYHKETCVRCCIHQVFEAQVDRAPNATALLSKNGPLTYRELNHRANRLAHYLQQLGVGPDVLVGLYLERSVQAVVALLAILKAGGAYVPLDPTYPQARLEFMLQDAEVSILLTQEHLLRRLPEYSGQAVCLDLLESKLTLQIQENPTSPVTGNNLAYLIYTSGSTGRPKGVLIQHQGLCNLAKAQIQFNLQPHHRILQFASLSFDASVFELVMALCSGATLCLPAPETLRDIAGLTECLQAWRITNLTAPPALLSVLPAEDLPMLQTVVSAGEACSAQLAQQWSLGREFFNAYGPTEATVWAAIEQFNDQSNNQLSNDTTPTLGRPIANTEIYVLNAQLQPVPIGVTGDLYIGGEGLARGYLNRPDLTAERFLPHPFSSKPGARLYKTGDLARYQADGRLVFLGRVDQQVKLRGYRIELGEIETRLNQHPKVQQAIVVACEENSGRRLIAYIVLQPGQELNKAELQAWSRKMLPVYMLPSAFVFLSTLPLTSAGKIDRQALSVANPARFESEKNWVAPRTPTEAKLTQIWAEVLKIERISVRDNFFELGGDSLTAMRLIAQVNQQFEQPLSLSTFFLKPTVEELAKAVTQAGPSTWSPLVPLQAEGAQSEGAKPPFFCVHPVLGMIFPYYELSLHLGKKQPFYGLQPLGLSGETPQSRIEDMASYYIEALRKIQPQGPYYLGGYSFGGLVAFEMAQQFWRQGQQVALLALLDTPVPAKRNQPGVFQVFKFLFATVAPFAWRFLLDYLHLIRAPGKKQKSKANLIPNESKRRILNELTIAPMLKVFRANSQAALAYQPQVYPGRIALFRTSDQDPQARRDPTLGWGQLALEGVKVYSVPGNHLSLLRKPQVQVLAQQLQECLEKAQLEP